LAAEEGKRELKGAKAASGSVRRASFENLTNFTNFERVTMF
jgi:hypothetical protein